MQEDFLGTRRSAMPTLVYVQCVRCGKATPRSDAKIVNTNALSESNTEFDYLCKDCQQAEDAGETEIIGDL